MNGIIDMNDYMPRDTQMTLQPESEERSIGFVALWSLLWHNKLRILAPAFVLAILAAIVVMRSSDTYTAETQIILTRGNLDIIEFDGGANTELTSGAMANAMTILNSREIALRVIDRLDLTSDPEINPLLQESYEETGSLRGWLGLSVDDEPGGDTDKALGEKMLAREYALEWLGDTISFLQVPSTNVIIIQAVTTDRVRSAEVANAYAESFLDYKLNFSQREVERATAALAKQVGKLRLQLKDDQEALRDYGAETTNVTDAAMQALSAEASNVRARLENIRENGRALDDAFAGLDRLAADPGMDARAVFDESPALLGLEIARLGSRVTAEELRAGLPDIHAGATAERERARQLETALQESLKRLDAQIIENSDFASGYRQLQVELETTSEVYEASLARLKELIIQSDVRDAGAQILAQAEVPLRYDAQGRRRLVVVAFILGLLLGAAYVLIRETTNDRVRTLSELADATGSKALVQVPKLNGGVLPRTSDGNSAMSANQSAFFEAVRSVRQALINSATPAREGRVVGIFSGLPREGKTTLAIALARSFAMVGRSVLLVDTDLRNSAMRRLLETEEKGPGLGKGLEEQNATLPDLVVRQVAPHLDVILGGQSSVSPADLLASSKFAELIATARSNYDIVILDTAPLLVAPDGGEAARLADQHVLVAEYDRSPQVSVRDATTLLQTLGAKRLIVALLNTPKVFGQQYGVSRRSFMRYRFD